MTAAATTSPDAALPDRFRDVDHLEEVMTTPSAALVADMAKMPGDLVILGVGGKIGPTLARLAKRAAPNKRVVGVARFSEAGLREKLTGWGIECIEADLLDRAQIDEAAQAAERGVHGRPQVRLGRRRRPDLGDELPRAGAGGRGLRQVAHRRLFVGLRVSLCRRHEGRRHRGDAGRPAARHLRLLLRRARSDVPAFLAHARHARALIRLNYAIDMRYGVLFDIATRRCTAARRSI